MKFSLTVAAILSTLSLQNNVDAFGVSTSRARSTLQLNSKNAVDIQAKATKVTSRMFVKTSMTQNGTDGGPKEIKVGVIGCGRIGIVHLGAITKAPNVTPVIVSNPTVSKAEQGKNKFMQTLIPIVT